METNERTEYIISEEQEKRIQSRADEMGLKFFGLSTSLPGFQSIARSYLFNECVYYNQETAAERDRLKEELKELKREISWLNEKQIELKAHEISLVIAETEEQYGIQIVLLQRRLDEANNFKEFWKNEVEEFRKMDVWQGNKITELTDEINKLREELKNTEEFLFASGDEKVRILKQLKEENERLKNDLLDAHDLKKGNGPTALSMVVADCDSLKRLNSELVKVAIQMLYEKDYLAMQLTEEYFENVRSLIEKAKQH